MKETISLTQYEMNVKTMALKTSDLPMRHAEDPSCRPGAVKKILFLASNPKDTAPLRLNEEAREIREGLRRSKYREHFEIHSLWAVRFKDLRRALLDVEPHIVHFSGYGEKNSLLLEDETGYAAPVTAGAVAELFALFSHTIECAVFTAGYCKQQAEAVNTAVKYVIAMPDEIKEEKTIDFILGFYDALGAGKTIEEAFKFGRNAMMTYERPSFLINPDIPVPPVRGHLTGREKEPRKTAAHDPGEEPWFQLRRDMQQMVKSSVYGECSLEIIFIEPQLTSILPDTKRGVSEIELGNALELLEDFVFKRNRFAGEDRGKLPALLFGDYGSGKSSTLRMLTARLGGRKNAPFPIFIPLREAILRNTDNLYESIEEFLLLNHNIKNLKEELHQRPICFLLDGFDELNMIEADETNWVYERYKEIERLAGISQCTVIVSSRPILFLGKTSNIAEETIRFTMELFDETRVRQWITKWLTLPRHKQSALSVKGLKDRNLFLECRNPLILFMVASLFDDELKKEKPYLRAEIFKTFIDSTESGKFYKEKDHQYIQPIPGNYRKVLQEIAFIIFRYGNAGLISKSDLKRYLPECENMEDILKKRRLRSLLVGHFFREAKATKMESYVEFSHQSFREYLVAEKFINVLLKTSEGNFNGIDWSNICCKMLTGSKMAFLMESLCLLSGEQRLRIFNTVKTYAMDPGGMEKQLINDQARDVMAVLKSIHFTSTIRKIISYFVCAVIASNGSDSFRKKLKFGDKSCLINIYHACHSYPHVSTIKNAWDLLINELPGGILGPRFQWSGFEPLCKTFSDYAVLSPSTHTIALINQYLVYVFMDLKKYHILHLGAAEASYCIFRGGTLLLANKKHTFERCVFIDCRIISLQDDIEVSTKNCSFERTTCINLDLCKKNKRNSGQCEEMARLAVEFLTDYTKKMECSHFVPWGGVVSEKFPEFEKVMFNTPTGSSVLSQSSLCRLNAMATE